MNLAHPDALCRRGAPSGLRALRAAFSTHFVQGLYVGFPTVGALQRPEVKFLLTPYSKHLVQCLVHRRQSINVEYNN